MLGCDGDNKLLAIKYPEEPERQEELIENYRILELSDNRLLEAIESGKKLWIRGSEDDEAILCTENETFKLRELVTSNMLLLVEKGKGAVGSVVCRPGSTLETSYYSRPPGIDQLLSALYSVPFDGGNDEIDLNALHVEKIYEHVQASASEIEKCLQNEGAIVIQNHFRVLGNHLLSRFFDLFLNTAILEDWDVLGSLVDINQTWVSFQQHEDEFPEGICRHILKVFSDEAGKLDFRKISRFFAGELLKARLTWDMEDFCLAWEKCLLDIYTPEIEEIGDMILTDRHPGSGRLELRRYLRTSLPSDVDKRFVALFKTRGRWRYEELIPFIKDLGKDTKELDAIVLKHGRVSNLNEARYITPRSQILE